MADRKISELTNITGANLADDDEFALVDTSADETKAITFGEFKTALDTATGFVRITGDTMTGDLSMGDNVKAIFGAGSDLQIYHDGSNSYVKDNGTGDLYLQGTANVRITNTSGQKMFLGQDGGEAQLYYSGSEKLATTSTGIDVTGTAVTDGLTVAGNVSVDGGTIKLDGNYPVGTGNVALGDLSFAALQSGATNNVSIGYYSGNALTTGGNNTALGAYAVHKTTTASGNTGIGRGAMYENSTGASNTAVGDQALYFNTTASNNTAVGYEAGYSTTTGSYSTSVGYQAHYSNTTGRNSALGYVALRSNTTGTNNTAVGDSSLYNSTTGNYNTAVGHEALQSNTTASENTAVGSLAAYSNTTGTRNTALGRASLYDNTTGNYNVALGYDSLANNTTASNNTAVGYQAGYSNTTGDRIVAVGEGSLYSNTTGGYNVALGSKPLRLNTTGANNTAVGHEALYDNTTGSNNTALGFEAGYNNTTGQYNTFIGKAAGKVSTSDFNTYIGHDAGLLMTSGQKNTILGRYNGNQSGLDIRTSSNNIVLSDGDGNPRGIFDSNGHFRVGTASNQWSTTDPKLQAYSDSGTKGGMAVKLESGTNLSYSGYSYWGRANGSGSTHYAFAFYDGPTGTTEGSISVTSSGTSYNTTSDYRLKENVVGLTGATERLKQLEPKRFNFIKEGDTPTVDGFLAHEVSSVVPEAVTGTHNEVDDDGNPVYQGIDQSKLVPLLVATIKELEARITALENA